VDRCRRLASLSRMHVDHNCTTGNGGQPYVAKRKRTRKPSAFVASPCIGPQNEGDALCQLFQTCTDKIELARYEAWHPQVTLRQPCPAKEYIR